MKKLARLPELTKRELDIMKILWSLKKGSVREVHNELIKIANVAYPTTKTILDRMVIKGYVKRENIHGIFVYCPVLTKPSGIAMLVKNFMENVLEIDKSAVTSLFLNSDALTKEELEELKKLLNKNVEKNNDK